MLTKISNNQLTQKKVFFYISTLILAVVLIPLFSIAHYGFMCADDFSFTLSSIESWRTDHSVIQVLKNQFIFAYGHYFNWQGTFSMEWLGSTLMVLIGEKHYYLGTYIALGGMITSELLLFIYVGINLVEADIYDVGVISCWLIVLQVLMVPYPVEAFYWSCSSILYTVGFSLCVLLIFLSILFLKLTTSMESGRLKTNVKYVALQIGILLLSMLIALGNFVSSIFCFLSFVLLVFILWIKKVHGRIAITFDAIIYTIFFIIEIMAPGNRARMAAARTTDTNAIKAIVKSILVAAEYIVVNMYPTVIIIVLMMAPFIIGLVKRKAFSNAKSFRFPLIFSIISFGLYAAQFVPTMYSIGILGAGRVINIYRFTMYLWLFSNIIYWMGWMLRRIYNDHPEIELAILETKKSYLLVTVAIEFAAFCFASYFYGGKTITTVSAIESLSSGQAQTYYEEYLSRLEILQDDSIEDAVLARFSDPPYLIYLDDITEDSSNWLNEDMARFYGKNSVVVEE